MVVGAVWVTLAIGSGLYFSFPVFFVALLEEFGWPRGATAAAFSISSIVQGAFSPVVGILVDRIGPRRVMLGGAFVLGSACVLASRIDSLWSLYLVTRSEEHTSELQSRPHLVCRLLLEKKKRHTTDDDIC